MSTLQMKRIQREIALLNKNKDIYEKDGLTYKVVENNGKTAIEATVIPLKDEKWGGKVEGKDFTLLVEFPDDYPHMPPYVYSLHYGSTYISSGGGICHEALSKNHWSPATTVHTLMVTLRYAFSGGFSRLHVISYNKKKAQADHLGYMNTHQWNS